MILAMDTSTPLGTVSGAAGGEVLSRAELGRQGTHASRLVPAIDHVLEEGGVDRDELEALVLGAGPGSFTGVRVAAATAKGMVHALGLPLYTFSSLAAAAAAVDRQLERAPNGSQVPDVRKAEARYVLFDARADRVYAGCWLPTDDGLDELIAPHATTIEALLSGEIPLSVFCGSGATRHEDELRGAGLAVLGPGIGMPTADGLVRLFAAAPDPVPVDDPGRWEPLYLRDTGAVRMRKQHGASDSPANGG